MVSGDHFGVLSQTRVQYFASATSVHRRLSLMTSDRLLSFPNPRLLIGKMGILITTL